MHCFLRILGLGGHEDLERLCRCAVEHRGKLDTVRGVSASGGVLNAAASTRVLTQDWSHTGGTFNHGTGMVLFTPDARDITIDTGGVPFYNVDVGLFGSCTLINDLKADGTFQVD